MLPGDRDGHRVLAGSPSGYGLLSNSQISSRTSPTLLDMVAAVATGLAGATALSRRDVAAVLPGVAIAISLVPPLVVAGVCFGQLAWALALGALTLFLSNLVALVVTGVAVFAVLAYTVEDGGDYGRSAPKVRLTLTVLFVAVTLPLAANTAGTLLINTWTGRVRNAATQWLSGQPGASVASVDVASRTIYVQVRSPEDVPPVENLMSDLKGEIPDGIPIVVETTRGRRIDAGPVGG